MTTRTEADEAVGVTIADVMHEIEQPEPPLMSPIGCGPLPPGGNEVSPPRLGSHA